MRLISILPAGCVVVAMALLMNGDRRQTQLLAQDTSKGSEKKIDEKKPIEKKPAPKVDQLDDEMLRRANVGADGESLLKFLKGRILPEAERPDIQRFVRQLDSSNYRVREKASRDLVRRGVAVLEILRTPIAPAKDCEAIRRVERSIQDIHEKDVAPGVPAAAIRTAAKQGPAGLVETLIGYLPFADNEAVLDESRAALAQHGIGKGKVDPQLLTALADRSVIRRAVAAEVIGRAAYADHKDALDKLLRDPDALVRFRLARALAFAKERDAVPILIDTLPELPLNDAWQAEDFLIKMAAGPSAPSIAMGNDKNTREKCKTAWHAWWKTHGAKVDLAKLEETPKLLGRTLIVLLDQNSVMELGPDNVPRWEIKLEAGRGFPLDAQTIGEDRVLIAEHRSNRVTERTLQGEIVWQKAIPGGPIVAQRLPNGNTFVATYNQLLEFDKDGAEVMHVSLSDKNEQLIMKAMKLPNGEIACMLATARIVRFDAQGKELHSFQIPMAMRLHGGRIHMLPTGRVLVPHPGEGKVVEYDANGKVVWEVPFPSPIVASRLPNGNTLITSMDPAIGAVEVDRAGAEVWTFRHASNTRVTRAIRR